MSSIKPFKALRPVAEKAAQVASRPYDVLNSSEARQEVKDNPDSFLYVTKSEISLPEATDLYSPAVYEKAKENLQAMIAKGTLTQEALPAYYIYELTMNGRSQTGLVATSSVDDYEQNKIKKHEFTRPDKELDRITHIKTTSAQTGNVFLAYRNNKKIDDLLNNWKANQAPLYDFIADDGITHKIWRIDNPATIAEITQIFDQEISHTYIADGHHRAASAAKVRAALGDKKTSASDYFLTTLFPANELYIMDYNRVVKDLNGLSKQDFLAAIKENFELESVGKNIVQPSQLHEMGMYLDGDWYRLKAKPNSYSNDPIGVLDISILSNKILSPLLGIKDQRTDSRIDFVGGIRGLKHLQERVDKGDMQLAFSLYPVSIEQLFDIADSGEVMPPKSTWFEPKLRDGLLTHLIG